MDFKQAQESFKQLKAQFEAGTLSETEFKSQLEELMVQDEGGSWWMIGYETERWYRHDGTNWVQSIPPGILAQESTPWKGAEPEAVETASREMAEREAAEKPANGRAAREKAEYEAVKKARNEKARKEIEAGELHYKGMLAQKEGKYDEAERLFRQSLAIAVELNDEQGKANILRQLAILTEDRLASQKRERENAEQAARAKAGREAAEKAAREKARQEAAERTAREKSAREAEEKASREKAEREADFKTIFEEMGFKTDERTTREKAEHKASEKPADVTKQRLEKSITNKNFLLSSPGRMLLGGGVGFLFGIMAGGYLELALINMVAGGLAGLIIYPHKLSIIFLILGVLVGGLSNTYFGIMLGIPAGALLSRILHWNKVLK